MRGWIIAILLCIAVGIGVAATDEPDPSRNRYVTEGTVVSIDGEYMVIEDGEGNRTRMYRHTAGDRKNPDLDNTVGVALVGDAVRVEYYYRNSNRWPGNYPVTFEFQ